MAVPIPNITGGASEAMGGESDTGNYKSSAGGLVLIKGDPWVTAGLVIAVVFMLWRITAKK